MAAKRERQIEIRKGMSQILAEGIDCYYFLIQALTAYNLTENIQVQDFGGITNLSDYLFRFKKLSNFKTIPALFIVRDAETDYNSAVRSVRSALENNGFAVPSAPYEIIGEKPAVGFMILPGTQTDGKPDNGALEDLCLATVDDEKTIEKVNDFLDEIEKIESLSHRHKSQLHAYLSAKNKFVGLKIGEAAKAGAWDWHHKAMQPLREILRHIHDDF